MKISRINGAVDKSTEFVQKYLEVLCRGRVSELRSLGSVLKFAQACHAISVVSRRRVIDYITEHGKVMDKLE